MSAKKIEPPAKIFKTYLTRPHFQYLFENFIADNAPVGRDGMRVDSFRDNIDGEITVALRKINGGIYKFTSYKEKLISKGPAKFPRQISIPTVRDKLVLKFMSELLADIYPDHVSKPPHAFVKQIHQISTSAPQNYFYLRLDIKSFFPSINHRILMRILRRRIRKSEILCLVEDSLATPTGMSKTIGNRSNLGVPQGLSISNILSSIYLEDIDRYFQNRSGINFFRFVDDILIIGSRENVESLAVEVPDILRKRRKLECYRVGEGSKSELVPMSQGIDYLGYHFAYGRIQVRSSSFKKMFANLMGLFTNMRYKQNRSPAIWRMNLRITGCQFKGHRIGWLYFFSQTNNVQQLKQLDAFVSRKAEKILPHDEATILKSFVKAYFEIRYNFAESKYLINFDEMNDEGKKRIIMMLVPQATAEYLDRLNDAELDSMYRRCIRREVSDLEKDMMAIFS